MRWSLMLLIVSLAATAQGAPFQKAAPLSALAKMPIKEITVFKDGHAFVLHSGRMPTDDAGNVLMDYLPTPVLGTFWPYLSEKDAKLSAVTASQHRVEVPRTALSVRELMEANPGAEVFVEEVGGKKYLARIVGVPERSGEESQATSPPNSPEKLPEKGNVILLKTDEGTAVVAFERILGVTFKGEYKKSLAQEEFRNLLTLKLGWPDQKPRKQADVGMLYLQKGIRWIPSYKISIDGKGEALVQLQATLINEMADLDDVTVNLVIGVPTFAFQETLDPIGLQQTMAQLSPYFQSNSQTSNAFSNSIMTQQMARSSERMAGMGGMGGPGAGAPPADLGPEVSGSDRSEDLFIFTVKHVSLKKGQRLAVRVTENTLKYKDAFTLEVPFAPPPEMRMHVQNPQQAALARLANSPKVQHKIRLTNLGNSPLTTAPALILSGDRVLAQGMMTYAAPGAVVDLALTTAPDIAVTKTDKEIKRTPHAGEWNGNRFGKIDLEGSIHLMNHRNQPVDLEVTRYVLGNVGRAGEGGVAEMINVFENGDFQSGGGYPQWWYGYGWPAWWSHFNGIGRITWKLTLPPQKGTDLSYTWNYYWQ
jgi:hypothetical protein